MKTTLISILVAFSFSSACADNGSTKGKAVIKVDGKAISFPLKKCYNSTKVLKGKAISIFIIATHKSRRSKEPGPRFRALGASNTSTASFHLSLDGGIKKGGIDYRNKLPFSSFKNNKLSFKGMANGIKKMGKKVIKNNVPIEINVSCL